VLVSLEGPPAALAELLDLVELPEDAEALGPVDLPPGASGDPLQRLLLRAPRARRATLVRAVKGALGVRSARKSEGAIRCRVDPVEIS
jgi:primosomal protein N' (replication factor Y)